MSHNNLSAVVEYERPCETTHTDLCQPYPRTLGKAAEWLDWVLTTPYAGERPDQSYVAALGGIFRHSTQTKASSRGDRLTQRVFIEGRVEKRQSASGPDVTKSMSCTPAISQNAV